MQIRCAIESPKLSDKVKKFQVVQYTFPGVFQAKVCQIHVKAQILFILFMALLTVFNFQLILNQISPPGNPIGIYNTVSPTQCVFTFLCCVFEVFHILKGYLLSAQV